MYKLSVLLPKFALFIMGGDINEALESLLAQLGIPKPEYLYVKSNSTYNWQIKAF